MEPETSASRPSPEMGNIPKGGENAASFSNAEQLKSRPIEQAPRSETRETLPSPTGGGPALTATPLPVLPPAPQQQSGSTSIAPQQVNDNPVVAADEDLIEKEWVDRAKKIIASTKNDPYLQEKEVSKLQADYLKKRYGKEVKLPTE